MAKEYTANVLTHSNIYKKDYHKENYTERKLRIEFSLPEGGVNYDTGLLLLISGFGGNLDSNVYKKMRTQFADQYNLITVQCEYFGNQYMLNDFLEIIKTMSEEELEMNISNRLFVHDYKETIDDFNDMGYMQAIDNINAVLYMINYMFSQNIVFNTKKIIIYGHSHGAYLGYLCNRLAPNLFDLIIDNSAWVIPAYLNSYRIFTPFESHPKFDNIIISYFVKDHKVLEDHAYDLTYLYKGFTSNCQIISCHGVDDQLVPIEIKRELLNHVDNMLLMEIEASDVDGELFRNSTHGLGADFLKFFDLVYGEYKEKFGYSNQISEADYTEIDLIDHLIEISYETILSTVTIHNKQPNNIDNH